MTDYSPSLAAKTILARAVKGSDGLDIWSLTGRLGLSIRNAAEAFKELEDAGFMRSDQETLYLTPLGRNWVMRNQAAFVFSGERTWRDVPPRFKANRLSAYSPYAPSTRLLGKKFS